MNSWRAPAAARAPQLRSFGGAALGSCRPSPCSGGLRRMRCEGGGRARLCRVQADDGDHGGRPRVGGGLHALAAQLHEPHAVLKAARAPPGWAPCRRPRAPARSAATARLCRQGSRRSVLPAVQRQRCSARNQTLSRTLPATSKRRCAPRRRPLPDNGACTLQANPKALLQAARQGTRTHAWRARGTQQMPGPPPSPAAHLIAPANVSAVYSPRLSPHATSAAATASCAARRRGLSCSACGGCQPSPVTARGLRARPAGGRSTSCSAPARAARGGVASNAAAALRPLQHSQAGRKGSWACCGQAQTRARPGSGRTPRAAGAAGGIAQRSAGAWARGEVGPTGLGGGVRASPSAARSCSTAARLAT